MASRKFVYLAGPIGKPEVMKPNALEAIRVANVLRGFGFMVFVPHLCVWWHEVTPYELDHWMEYDFAWLSRCDALYRMPGHSPGADKEIEHARSKLSIPVFFNLSDLLMWARK
jgi:hypothetical protein